MNRMLARAYSVLLRLLAPAALRREYGEQIELVFAQLLEEARQGGRLQVVRVWAREIVQLAGIVRTLSRPAESRGLGKRARSTGQYREFLRTDLRLAALGLSRRPLFSLSVVVTLGVGLGLTAAVYSAARASILAEIPIPDADRVVIVTGAISSPQWTGRTGMTFGELQDLRERSSAFDDLALFSLSGDVTHSGDTRAERFRVTYVSPSYFDVIGAHAAVGRVFDPDDPLVGDGAQVVLAHHVWMGRFDGDPDVLGTSVHLAGTDYTVIGVMPEDHRGLARGPRPFDAWLPLQHSSGVLGAGVLTSFNNAQFWGVGRMRTGVSVDDAESEVESLQGEFAKKHTFPADQSAGIMELPDYFFGGSQRPLAALALGAVFVLLVCGVNLAFLIGLRERGRRAELAIRSVLGASRPRLFQTLLAESVLLSVFGVLLAIAIAKLAISIFLLRFGFALFRFEPITLGGSVVVVCAVVAMFLTTLPMATSVAFAGLRQRSPGVVGLAAGQRRWSDWVVASETILAVIVLVSATLSARSLTELRAVELGYEPAGLHSVRMSLVGSDHGESGGPGRFVRELADRIAALPGVTAGVMAPDMMGRSVTHVYMSPQGVDPSQLANVSRVQWISLTPGMFETLGIELIEGRDIQWSDRPGSPIVAVVSERTAERLWPGEPALGKRFHLNQNREANAVVVGVVRRARHVGRYSNSLVIGDAYFSFLQRPSPKLSLLYRTDAVSPPTLSDVGAVVESIDHRVALFDANPMEARLIGEENGLRLVLALSTIYAVIAVALALCGLVGLTATAVHERRRELAVRRALGADRHSLIWELVRRALVALMFGVLVGSGAAVLATEPLSRFYFGVSRTDPLTYALVALAVTVLGVAATWIPALQTARIAPAEVTRSI